MLLKRACGLWCLVLVGWVGSAFGAGKVTLTKSDTKITVQIDGKLFTELIYKGKRTPLLYPIIGPNGNGLTRKYPLEKAGPGEQKDHVHHTSLWFTHGKVNGVDFWHSKGNKVNRIVPSKVTVGKDHVILNNDWISSSDKKILTDVQRIGFGDRYIDYTVTLMASEGEVKLGDTKEGSMAIRTHPALRVTGKVAKGKANNSAGHKGKALWGKAAKWVDYYGPLEGKVVGISIYDHPSNPRHPTTWHARDYGLITANPFGLSYFKPKDRPRNGDMIIKAGESVTFHYRFVFHAGDTDTAKVDEQWTVWSKTAVPGAGAKGPQGAK
jgi:hypothetical protein